MNFGTHAVEPAFKITRLWISDQEVRSIFASTRCTYRQTNGFYMQEMQAKFVREQRSKEGTLGFVLRSGLTHENWLWVISKKTRQPFALAKVS